MKTSTKILIFLLLCIPISLLAYNGLLKQKLAEKVFLTEMIANPADGFIVKKLKPFKHLTVNGILYTGAGEKQAAGDVSWAAHVHVQNLKALPFDIRFPRKLASIVNYVIKGDTLYISYYKATNPHELDNQYEYGPTITIDGAGSLESVSGSNTKFSSQGNFEFKKPFSIALSNNSEYEMGDIGGICFSNLNISAKDNSKFKISTVSADTLKYSLLDKSKMDIEPVNIQNFKAGTVSNQAQIGLNGRANQLKALLK